MHPKRAMGRNAVEAHFGFGKNLFDLPCALESFVGLEHVVGGLRAGGAGFLGVIEELGEVLGAVLRPFDAGMKTSFGHRIFAQLNGFGHLERARPISTIEVESNWNSHYGRFNRRRVRAPGLHPPQNRLLVGRVPSPGFPIWSTMRTAVPGYRALVSLSFV